MRLHVGRIGVSGTVLCRSACCTMYVRLGYAGSRFLIRTVIMTIVLVLVRVLIVDGNEGWYGGHLCVDVRTVFLCWLALALGTGCAYARCSVVLLAVGCSTY
jgi:hypothetical protein